MSEITSTLVPAADAALTGPVVGTQGVETPAATVDSGAPNIAAAKEAEDRFAAKFAALSRKEKAIKQQEQAWAQKERDWQAKLAQMETDYKSKYVDPSALKKNLLGTLSQHGYSADQIAELILNDGKQTPERMIEERTKELESKYGSKFEELEKKLAAKEDAERSARAEAATADFKKSIADFVASTPAEYELITANDAHDLVYDTIEEYYNQSLKEATEAGEPDAKGKILTNKEACDLVEKYLEDEAKKIFSKAQTKLSKFMSPEAQKSTDAAQTASRQSSPTLSNAMSTSSKVVDQSKLSDEQSKAEAAKLIKWLE